MKEVKISNETIKKIEKLAKDYTKQYKKEMHSRGYYHDDLTEVFNQKFAELIVRECADICEKDGRWWADQGYLMEAGEAGSLATQIKEHFGVK